jgi:hypothetical protein
VAAWPRPGHKQALLLLPSLDRIPSLSKRVRDIKVGGTPLLQPPLAPPYPRRGISNSPAQMRRGWGWCVAGPPESPCTGRWNRAGRDPHLQLLRRAPSPRQTLAESRRKRYPALYAETALKLGLRRSLLCGTRSPFFCGRNRVLPFFHAGFWYAGASPVTPETEDSP